MKKISMFLRNQPPGRMIVGGFAAVILFGMILLLLPISVKDGAEVSDSEDTEEAADAETTDETAEDTEAAE